MSSEKSVVSRAIDGFRRQAARGQRHPPVKPYRTSPGDTSPSTPWFERWRGDPRAAGGTQFHTALRMGAPDNEPWRQAMALDIVPSPPTPYRFPSDIATRVVSWIKGHAKGSERTLAGEQMQCLQMYSFDNLLVTVSALLTKADSLMEPGEPYIAIADTEAKKSSAWLWNLAWAMNVIGPPMAITNVQDVSSALDRVTGPVAIVVLDDAAYSGAQMSKTIARLADAISSAANGAMVTVHICTCYATNVARFRISKQIHTSAPISARGATDGSSGTFLMHMGKSMQSIGQNVIDRYGIDQKVGSTLRRLCIQYPLQAANYGSSTPAAMADVFNGILPIQLPLVVFEHKLANYQSVLVSVLNGFISDTRGRVRQDLAPDGSGKRVPALRRLFLYIIPPYKRVDADTADDKEILAAIKKSAALPLHKAPMTGERFVERRSSQYLVYAMMRIIAQGDAAEAMARSMVEFMISDHGPGTTQRTLTTIDLISLVARDVHAMSQHTAWAIEYDFIVGHLSDFIRRVFEIGGHVRTSARGGDIMSETLYDNDYILGILDQWVTSHRTQRADRKLPFTRGGGQRGRQQQQGRRGRGRQPRRRQSRQ